MRDRLIELIKQGNGGYDFMSLERIADHLLANGVIVPPCKVGDKVYMLVTKRSKVSFPPFTFVKVSRLTFYNLERVLQDFGKTVFLTREEAEAKLKGEQ